MRLPDQCLETAAFYVGGSAAIRAQPRDFMRDSPPLPTGRQA